MENLISRKLRLGISACQFGARVRYNGKGRDMTEYLGRDRGEFIWTPLCPEIMSGLGVQRTSIKLSQGNGYDFWKGEAQIKDRLGENKTELIKRGCQISMETLEKANIDAFIFMEGSPSCGINRTTLKNNREGHPPGVFGALLLEKNIFLINSLDLQSPLKWWDIKRRLVTFVWVKEASIKSKSELENMWKKIKFLLYEIEEERSQNLEIEIEKILTSSSQLKTQETENIKSEILNILRLSSSVENIKKYLWINYLDFKERENIEIHDIYEANKLRGMNHLANELLRIEIEAKKANLLFKSSPINYKPKG